MPKRCIKMNQNSHPRTTSQIVYTSVDDDMSVTEIICEYGDGDETATEAVCEVVAPDLTQSHIYIEDSDSTPVIREEKIYIETTDVLHPNQSLKQEEIYIEDGMGDSLHQIFAEDKKFKCGVCSEQFDDLPTISRHMEEHSGEKKYECAECGKQFKNINNVMRHMVVHSGERKYLCPSCNKPFTQIGNLKRHMQIHSGEKKYPCNACGKSFTQMNNLIRHQAIHSGKKNFECPMCHRLFNQVSNLNRHVLIHKGIKMFKCEVCGRAFSQLINLQKHKERHMRDKKYKCNECEVGFDHKLAYNKHLEVHYGKPRYQCNICGRVVTQKSTLNQHMLLHDEDKQYACRQCHKSYAQKGSLSKHLEAHNNVRHPCKVCNRYFYDEKGLLKHESTHTDKAKSIASFVEKEIKVPDYELQFCDICGRSFILKRSLKKHMAKAHAISVEGKKKLLIEEHPCELCGKVFVHRKSLKKHAFNKHGVTIEFSTDKNLKFVSGTEKENQGIDLTSENEDIHDSDDPSASILNKADIAEALINIKQENVIEADTSLEDGENVWKNFSCFKVKEEPVAKETSDSAVHLCKICGRGYYLINNLRKHMAMKHRIVLEKESEEDAQNETSTELENEANTMQTDSVREEKVGRLNDKVNVEKTGTKLILLSKIHNDDVDSLEEKKGAGKKRKDVDGPDNSCRICGKDFHSSVDLLLHMLDHSKDKKDDLLNVVNEAAQEFQNMKSEADLRVTEKTKGLMSHFRKCSRSQSAVITSVFSINEKYQETCSAKIASSSTSNSKKHSLEESIVSEFVEEEDLEGVKEEIIEIAELADNLDGSMPIFS